MPYLTASNGLEIYYEQHGEDGPPVLLLHGYGSSLRIWQKQFDSLGRHFKVYALDFPGHGRSQWANRYSLSMLAEIIKDFLDHIKCSRIALIALSLGCPIALTFAVRYPSSVTHIVLESPVAGGAPWYYPTFWLDVFFFRALPAILLITVAIFGYGFVIHFANTLGVKSSRNIEMLESMQSATDLKAFRALFWESAVPFYSRKLKEIKAPVLIIRGKEDPLPAYFAGYIQSRIQGPCTYASIPNIRHLVALEQPELFNKAVISFLNQDNKI